jgi:hypothetical protein
MGRLKQKLKSEQAYSWREIWKLEVEVTCSKLCMALLGPHLVGRQCHATMNNASNGFFSLLVQYPFLCGCKVQNLHATSMVSRSNGTKGLLESPPPYKWRRRKWSAWGEGPPKHTTYMSRVAVSNLLS